MGSDAELELGPDLSLYTLCAVVASSHDLSGGERLGSTSLPFFGDHNECRENMLGL